MSSSVANGKSIHGATRVAPGRLGRSQAPKRTAVQEVPLKLVKREINNPTTKVNVLHKQQTDDENDEEDEGDTIYSNTSDGTDSESDDVDCEIESRMALGHRSRVPSSASTLTCPGGDVSSCLSASTFLALPRLLSHTLTQVGC